VREERGCEVVRAFPLAPYFWMRSQGILFSCTGMLGEHGRKTLVLQGGICSVVSGVLVLLISFFGWSIRDTEAGNAVRLT